MVNAPGRNMGLGATDGGQRAPQSRGKSLGTTAKPPAKRQGSVCIGGPKKDTAEREGRPGCGGETAVTAQCEPTFPRPRFSPSGALFSCSSIQFSLWVTLSCSVADCPRDWAQCFAYLTLRGAGKSCKTSLVNSRAATPPCAVPRMASIRFRACNVPFRRAGTSSGVSYHFSYQ
ncbi:hypothetical protein GQ607_013691 [Colletotrichum asianum]|uniref:Uncharacterized protein n=1 Tax=Colletotrichum asianum TaxID=702518 RepID=A0A8H3ZPM4_9PEZI|nr:hypothetical protein GQ607_013691 [Colletotrichum asianum]